MHPAAMLRERLYAASRLARLPLPEPNRPSEVATGEQVPIGAPGQRDDRVGMRHLLEEGAQLRVPEPDGAIKSPTGEQAAIGGESQTGDPLRLPTRPEQGPTGHVPQLDAAIRAPAREHAFVRAEGEAPDTVRVGPPDQVQALACLLLHPPYPHFPPLAPGGPILPAGADSDRPDGIEGLRKDTLTHHGSGQIRILHLDPLQVRPTNGEP